MRAAVAHNGTTATTPKNHRRDSRMNGSRILRKAAYLALGALLIGCGGGGGGTGGGGGRSIGNLSAMLNLGDAASDRLVSCAVTVNSVTFTQTGGASAQVLAAPVTIELLHKNADVAPVIVSATFSQGTYNQVTVVLGTATMTFVDALGNLITRTPSITSSTIVVPITANLSSATSVALNVDLDLQASVAIDPSNNVTLTPTFIVAANPAAVAGTQIPETGAVRDMEASVVSVASPNVTVFVKQAAMNFTFVTSSST